MARRSAGLVLYRRGATGIEVLLVHPGGPMWARRDEGAWSIPKGEYDPVTEDPEAVARREFQEELGCAPPAGGWSSLGSVRQRGGKEVVAFAAEGDLDPTRLVSNEVEMEWPPRSGRIVSFPEVDRAAWCAIEDARRRLNPAQGPLLDRLVDLLQTGG